MARTILEGIMKRKYFFHLADEINGNASARGFGKKLKIDGIGIYSNAVKFAEFDNLCVNLNIELHDGELRNDGQNAQTVL